MNQPTLDEQSTALLQMIGLEPRFVRDFGPPLLLPARGLVLVDEAIPASQIPEMVDCAFIEAARLTAGGAR